MKTGWSRTTIAIVLAVVGIVVAPIVVRGFPKEVARWHLAAALNAVTANKVDAAERSLQKAIEWNPHVAEDINYWLLRVSQASGDDPTRQWEVLKEGVRSFPRLRRLGRQLADQQADEGDFKSALEFAKYAHLDEPPRGADELNQLAYYRALAGEDLDLALEEINRALELAPKNPSLVDTRAWVLFQMGKLTEALEDANFAVNAMKESFDSQVPRLDRPNSETAERAAKSFANNPNDPPIANSGDLSKVEKVTLTRRTAGKGVWGLGALRYHRAKILQSLGRESEATEDLQWLKDHRLPQDDSLF